MALWSMRSLRSRAYRERFGRVLHYNMDKGLLAAS
jgi:S-adenosylmethionine synthetase